MREWNQSLFERQLKQHLKSSTLLVFLIQATVLVAAYFGNASLLVMFLLSNLISATWLVWGVKNTSEGLNVGTFVVALVISPLATILILPSVVIEIIISFLAWFIKSITR